MSTGLSILGSGNLPSNLADAFVLSRVEIVLVLFAAALLLFVLLQRYGYRQSHRQQSSRLALGKRIAEFGERVAVTPLEAIDAAIVDGLNSIIELLDADRLCWYELNEDTSSLLQRYTACAAQPPLSPKMIPAGEIPFMAERLGLMQTVLIRTLEELPAEANTDRQFLQNLGVKSLLLIPSRFSPRKKGVLGLSSYSVERTWPEDSISQLAIASNIIGATLERKYAEEAGQESEDRFQYLFAQASIGIALETMEGRILEVNPAFCSMLGYTSDELRTLGCAHISHPDDEAVEMVLFAELRQGLRPNYRIEKRFFRKDGSQMWGQVSVSLLDRNHGSPPLIIGMVSDVTAQKTVEACLRQRDDELQRLAGHLIEAQEEERRRISRELHDDIGQRVALLSCELDLVHNSSKAQSRHEREAAVLPKVRKELDSIATGIHELSHELHSASLQCCGLKVALKDLCWKYSNNHHLEVELQAEHFDAKLPPDVALCLFRVAQEALANALKHSHTKKVFVTVDQDAEKVRLTVKDFGIGFDPGAQSGGIGLMSMRERLRFCGGLLSVTSAPNAGTEIAAEVAAPKKLAASASGGSSVLSN